MTEAKIYSAISAAMADIGAVGKSSWNDQQKFKFRGIDAVMNALNPALVKHRIFVVPEILEQIREDRVSSRGNALIYSICKVRFTFYAEDGSSVAATVIGEGMDSGDKATNKAMSIAFKYACFQVFCIPTEEMVDPDAESPEIKKTEKIKGPTCTRCKKELHDIRTNDGKTMTAEQLKDFSLTKYKDIYCDKCMVQLEESFKRLKGNKNAEA